MTTELTTSVIKLNGTRSHSSQKWNGTKGPMRLLVYSMFFLCAGIPSLSKSQVSSQPKSAGLCVLSGGLDREVRIENCGEGQVVHADGTVKLSKPVLDKFAAALVDWNKVEKLDFKKPFPISFPTEKSANALMFGPRLGYLLKTKSGFVVRQVAFFDNGPDYFEESMARFVARDGKLGFLDERLKTVISARYDFATPFSGGYSVICLSDKKNPCTRHKAEEEEHSTVVGGTWAVINKNGKMIKGPGLSQADAYRFVSEKRGGN